MAPSKTSKSKAANVAPKTVSSRNGPTKPLTRASRIVPKSPHAIEPPSESDTEKHVPATNAHSQLTSVPSSAVKAPSSKKAPRKASTAKKEARASQAKSSIGEKRLKMKTADESGEVRRLKG